jgi:2,4-dienoyl-CoA reductase-like NADH-dependent reductase (Old Yellow Enzyme family)
MYQGTEGIERIETWSHLCSQIVAQYSGQSEKLSYVHLIEPRQDRIDENPELFRKGWTLPEVSNEPFRTILQAASIPCISCGGWDITNAANGVEKGWDCIAFARWFVSNPDLPERLRVGAELQAFDRSRFYGSWDGVREHGYTDYPQLGGATK